MPAVKLRDDTLAVLGSLRGRFGAGHSYDALIQELVRRQIDGTVSAALAGDRLKRIEEMLIQLVIRTGDAGSLPAQPKFKIE